MTNARPDAGEVSISEESLSLETQAAIDTPAPWITVPHRNGDVVVDWGILWWWPEIRKDFGKRH